MGPKSKNFNFKESHHKDTEAVEFRKIGEIRSPFRTKFGTPRQPGLVETHCFVEIDSEFQPEISLQGLERASHLWVLFYFHQNSSSHFHAKVHPPRLSGESLGVFATRSPHRPNPIGLSVCKIIDIEKNGIWVEALDVIDGTPVLDIKPYLPEVEALPGAQFIWPSKTAADSMSLLSVRWSQIARNSLQNMQVPDSFPALVEKCLALDPRPLAYKLEGARPWHRMYFGDFDVHFRFIPSSRASGGGEIVIENVLRQPWELLSPQRNSMPHPKSEL
ncbi:MAG: tRNA (N6-threonylcarbamoyladenosine(37)-N6)-methyltransferase TrmO [Bdellovibrio sp.]